MGAKQSKSLTDTVFEVKMVKKQLDIAHKKCEKEHGKEKAKVKKAIEQGNAETARIYAENAIRKKNEALNFLKLSAKMDAVASRLESAEKSQQISGSIKGAIPELEKALKTMSPEQMAANMGTFEKIFEDLDVTTDYMTGAINNTTTALMPAGDVDQLIKEVGDEHSLEVGGMMRDGNLENNPGARARPEVKTEADADVDRSLEARLAQLRQ